MKGSANTEDDRYTGAGAASNLTYSTSMRFTLCRPQADIDNENHWGARYFTDDYKTPASRALRDQIGKDKSKILFVNDIDKDGSGTPDYMDGWGCTFQQIPTLEREKLGAHRMLNPENKLVPMSVTLEGLPTSIDTGNVRIKFDYPESPPETMQRVALSGSIWGILINASGCDPVYKITSPTGYIRIWKKDGDAVRNVVADYVRSNQTLVSYSELQSLGGKFYLEAVNACTNWSGVRIVVSLSLDGGSTWAMSNAVRVTSMRCNFTAGVVRQFSKDWLTGERKLFEPDYSSPAAVLRQSAAAQVSGEKYIGLFPSWLHRFDDKHWHDADAALGHGFAYFQYEGPNLGNALFTACSTGTAPQYDHKYYWGKTGDSGFTHWDYGAGKKNDPIDLAWWDICPYTIEGKFLVLKQAYTLQPDRASRLFDTFNDTEPSGRYAKFGLHISTDPNVKGWGCLSNVGLAMVDNNLDVANITRCVVNTNMPTTVNQPAWEVLLGAYYIEGKNPLARLRFVRRVLSAISGETEGVAWGEDKPVTQQGGGALQGKLFNALNGETIARRNPDDPSGMPPIVDLTITNINQVLLQDHRTDNLRYYDPGKFPGVFGELPKNVFNMEE